MARPKNKIKRSPICTTIKEDLLVKLKEVSEAEGVTINRLILGEVKCYLT